MVVDLGLGRPKDPTEALAQCRITPHALQSRGPVALSGELLRVWTFVKLSDGIGIVQPLRPSRRWRDSLISGKVATSYTSSLTIHSTTAERI